MESIIENLPDGLWRELALKHPEGIPLLLELSRQRGGEEIYIPYFNVAQRKYQHVQFNVEITPA